MTGAQQPGNQGLWSPVMGSDWRFLVRFAFASLLGIFGAIFGAFFSVLMGRSLPPGDFAEVLSFLALVAVLATLTYGLQSNAVMSAADELALGSRKQPRINRANPRSFVTLMTFALLAWLAIGLWALPNLWLFVLLIPGTIYLSAIFSSWLIGSGHLIQNSIFSLTLAGGNLIAQLLSIWFGGVSSATSQRVVAVYTVTSIFITLFFVILNSGYRLRSPVFRPGLATHTLFIFGIWFGLSADMLFAPRLLGAVEAGAYAMSLVAPKFLLVVGSAWGLALLGRARRRQLGNSTTFKVLSLSCLLFAISGIIAFLAHLGGVLDVRELLFPATALPRDALTFLPWLWTIPPVMVSILAWWPLEMKHRSTISAFALAGLVAYLYFITFHASSAYILGWASFTYGIVSLLGILTSWFLRLRGS